MRALAFLLVCAITGCGAPPAPTSSPNATVVEAVADAAYPFPTIQATTLADLKQAACGWARAHYRAPQKARADAPAIYRELIGAEVGTSPNILQPGFIENVAPPALGFQDTFVAQPASQNRNNPPQYLADFFTAAATYRLHLVARADANNPGDNFCPTTRQQTAYADASLLDASGGAQMVCVAVSRGEPPAGAQTLEHFENILIASGKYNVRWSGYRWSGGGGALVAEPNFTVPGDEYTGEDDLHCPGIHVGGMSDPPNEYDMREWLMKLAPAF